MSDAGQFDYVIVGAGAGGCALANRLSRDSSVRVLLLEAGPEDTNVWMKIPAGVPRVVAIVVFSLFVARQPFGRRRRRARFGLSVAGGAGLPHRQQLHRMVCAASGVGG